jgi:hypothetical protein
MTCQEIQHWLLLSKPLDPLPAAVRRHLAGCPRCRQRCDQLRLLDEQVRGLPPPPNPATKARLLTHLATVPQTPASAPPSPPSRLYLRWVAAAAIAASLLVAWAWTIARRPALPDPPTNEESKVPSFHPEEAAIVVRVAEVDVRLARPAATEEPLDLMSRLAGDLKDEALRRARQEPSEAVLLLADLSAYVLRQGVVGRAAVLPAGQRPDRVAPLLRQLRAIEAEIDAYSKEALPVVADMLRPLAAAVRESAQRIEDGRPPADTGPIPDGPARPLLVTLVIHAVRLAETGDPLRRADLSADLAPLLAQAIVLLSAGGDAERAEKLGDCLGDLLGRGVGENLKQVEADGAPEARRAEAEKVRERSGQAVTILERNREQLPAAARKGLEHALEKIKPSV